MKSRIQIHLKLHTSTNLLELLTEPDPKFKKFLLKESDMILDEPATGTDYFFLNNDNQDSSKTKFYDLAFSACYFATAKMMQLKKTNQFSSNTISISVAMIF